MVRYLLLGSLLFFAVGGAFGRAGAMSLLTLEPRTPSAADETHAALALVSVEFSGNVAFTGRVRTAKQLRTQTTPNGWESVWVVWHYRDAEHFYYLALKPNGWELGKRDPAYAGGQRFLASGEAPRLPVGVWATFGVLQTGDRITVSLDGSLLTSMRDSVAPLYDHGQAGVYTEDARVTVDRAAFSLLGGHLEQAPEAPVCSDGARVAGWMFPFLGFGCASFSQ